MVTYVGGEEVLYPGGDVDDVMEDALELANMKTLLWTKYAFI
jgi:hypothetical protein